MGVAEAAGTEIIHYGLTEILPGVVINMQTMYMSWLTMLIVAAIVFAATRHVERIPHGIQNLVEMFIEWLDKLMDANLGIEGRRMATPFVITLFLFIFVANEIGLMPSIAFHFRHLRMISTWRWVYPSWLRWQPISLAASSRDRNTSNISFLLLPSCCRSIFWKSSQSH